MSLDWYFERLGAHDGRPAFMTEERVTSYTELLALASEFEARLAGLGIEPGAVVALSGRDPAATAAAFLALLKRRVIIVPTPVGAPALVESCLDIAEVQTTVTARGGALEAQPRRREAPQNPLTQEVRGRGHPGLVLFSSGSTGKPKGALHDLDRLLLRYQKPRNGMRTLLFMLLDHIGGVNTLLHALANGGAIVMPEERTPEAVCRAIERHQVELLPTSPTFLNMLLISEAHKRFALGSLKLITYGTEVMPQATLKALHEAMPSVRLQQTYGMTEVGILQTRSKDSASLWMQLGGDGYETKVVDGRLFIRAQTAMLGYLNAPSPFDAEGWLDTGDRVEVDGDHMRVLGRESELINVGGEKVYPAEVEDVLLGLANVKSVLVFAHPSPITGHVVGARLVLHQAEDAAALQKRVREACQKALAPYKIPRKIEVVEQEEAVGPRFKKMRAKSEGQA